MRGALAALLVLLGACGSTYGRLRPESEVPALASLHSAYEALPWRTERVEAGNAAGRPVRVALHAADGPSGPRLVFLHGTLSDHATWRFLAGDLGADHPLLLVDFPGCGASDRPDPRECGDAVYAPESLARFVLAALRARGGEERLVLVGHSLGGTVALRALGDPALRREFADVVGRIDAMVLLAAVDVALERAHPGFRAIARASGLAIGTASLLGVLKERVARAVLESADDPAFALVGEADRILAVLRDPQRRRAAQAMLRAAVPFTDEERPDWPRIEAIVGRYGEVGVPCLVLWGARDETFPVSMGYKLAAQLPRARRVVLERAKHSPHHDVPARCAALVREFVAESREADRFASARSGPIIGTCDEPSLRASCFCRSRAAWRSRPRPSWARRSTASSSTRTTRRTATTRPTIRRPTTPH